MVAVLGYHPSGDFVLKGELNVRPVVRYMLREMAACHKKEAIQRAGTRGGKLYKLCV